MERSCIDTIVEYAREQAVRPAPSNHAGPEWTECWAQARWRAARIWLWLPVLWDIRGGDATPGWRQSIEATAQTAGATSPEITSVVMDLAELPSQPWDPDAHRWPTTTPAAAADTWYQTVSTLLFDVTFHVHRAVAEHRADPDSRWHTETVPAACQMAAGVLGQSWWVARSEGATEAAAWGASPADRRLIETPAPWYWQYLPPRKRTQAPDRAAIEELRAQLLGEPRPGLDPRVAEAMDEQTRKSVALLEAIAEDR
ncbi:hypothetical protein [[Mycobacterium] vasticus]|uniref:Uncharacterized protein n=1 Tax=[Mycobacterium] vasticus TaxID=2875777 RepID=A0ABU5Z4E3_9MYCO|nr:hypothetical protein [Mycolicibacter sp. MYC017]MEB3071956.1 hypothetical protein [Mycolicibacter sp. MYC017]